MGPTVIKIQNISKKYRIGLQRHDTLRDSLADLARRGLSSRSPVESATTFWALSDVSLEIKQGEIVGLIGRNGSGKSTLLKILARITEPTSGRIELFGRVGALLEVGTGFHAELTGRENIYLNGAFLGLTRKEINSKLVEIIDFAELEKFIDTPVKRYSSGMYVRLAFAVAAHLEPEILLVDEVLAVGDASFQRKCLGKMNSIAGEGRTIIFVSHNMSAIQTLCSRGILLGEGKIILTDGISNVVSYYLSSLEQLATQPLAVRSDRSGKGDIRLIGVDIISPGERTTKTLSTGRPVDFVFKVSGVKPGIGCNFTIYNLLGQPISQFKSSLVSDKDRFTHDGNNEIVCKIDELLLMPGTYRIDVGILSNNEVEDHLDAAALFIVEEGHIRGRPTVNNTSYGYTALPHRWEIP